MYLSTLEAAQQTILDHLPVAIIIIDDTGLVHYYNQTADKLLPTDFFKSANLTLFTNEFNSDDLQQVIKQLKEHSAEQILALHLIHDRLFQLKLVANPEQQGFYLITLNAIEEKSEQKVDKKIENNSLLKKNFKELKQFSRLSAMREISSFFADKLNQPLTAILSYTQAMQRLYLSDASSDEIKKAMKRVVVNAENTGKIIKDIRAQLNVNTLNYQKVCMNQLIQESIHLTELDNLFSPIKFTTHYEPAFMTLCVDKTQMRQVIFSLLNNAIDAVMEGSISAPEIILSTHLSSHSDTDSKYKITISDNGPGFPAEIIKHLFEPFNTSKKNGIGIGLSMCHHIISLHKGSISLKTQGSTEITICLPVTSSEDDHCQ